jgi:hypothetical protein
LHYPVIVLYFIRRGDYIDKHAKNKDGSGVYQ